METMTKDKALPSPEQAPVDQLVDAGLLDELMSRVGAGDLQLTGEGGFLPGLIKAMLEVLLDRSLPTKDQLGVHVRRSGGQLRAAPAQD